MQPLFALNQTGRRTLALVMVFCAVLVLLLATALTSQAFVKSTGHDTLDDFVQGSFSRTGLLQLPEEQSVQLMPMGLVLHWDVASSPLNSGLREMAAVAAGGHIVVMGGLKSSSGGWTNEVQISTIQAGGAPGAWQEQANALPYNVAGASAAAHTPEGADHSWVYLAGGIGGIGGTTWYSNVLRTRLDHTTGTVGPWTNVEGLDFKCKNLQLVALDGYLYMVGGEGIDIGGPFTSDEVYYASINPADGSLGAWQRTSDLPEPLESFLVLPYQEGDITSLYAIGGRTEGFPANTAHVWYADIFTATGALDAWGPLAVSDWRFGDLPHTLFGHSGALVADAMLVTGGNEQEEGGSENTTRNIRAALIDTEEGDYRLYNWCGDVPYPQCTIGAWAAGEGLPEKRVWHATVASDPFFYTLGGATSKTGTPLTSVYWGGVVADTLDAYYAPSGYYVSPEFDLGLPRIPRRVEWDITLGFPEQQDLDLTYRTAGMDHTWSDWQVTVGSEDGLNGHDIPSETGEIRYLQYRVDMTTEISKSSPLLNKVDLYYEVDDPEVEVRKDTGIVISAELGTVLNYTIMYTNNGGVKAEGVVLTETLPAHTTYASGAGWTQIGSSGVYTHWVGDLGAGEILHAQFSVRVNNTVPAGVDTIDNVVEIGFPPMIDELEELVPDPDLDNNRFEFSNPLSAFAVTISKNADPIPGTQLTTGQEIKYTLTYENIGQETLTNLVLEDTLHARIEYVADSIWPAAQGDDNNTGKLKWTVPSLAPGESGTAGFTVKVRDGTPDGTVITNKCSAVSDQTSAKDSETISHPVGVPEPGQEYDLTLIKSAEPPDYSKVAPGDEIDYTLAYENTGEEPLTGLELSDVLPDDVTYVAGSIWPAAKGNDSDPTHLKWTIGNLAVGDSGTVGFSVKVQDDLPGSVRITNLFTGQCDQIELASSNMTHHDTYIDGPDLVVTKIRAETAEPQIGEPFNLVVTVKNQGNQDANDGEFWVELYVKPYPAVWPTGPADHELGFCLGSNCARDQHVEYIASLAAGKSFDFRFEGIVLPGGGINQVFAQADICFVGYHCRDPRFGWYLEQNENNNIRAMILTGNVVHLPMIPKNLSSQ